MKALKAAGYDCPIAHRHQPRRELAAHGAVLRHPRRADRDQEQRLSAASTPSSPSTRRKFVQFVTDLKSWYDAGPRQAQVAEDRRGLRRRLRRRPLPDDADLGRRPRHDRPHRRSRHALGRRHAAGLCRHRAPELARRRRLALGAEGQVAGRVQGRRGLPQLHRPARAGAVLVDQSPATSRSPRPATTTWSSNGFYDKAPYKGREIAIAQPDRYAADAADPRHPPRRHAADPPRSRQRPAGDLRRQGLGAAGRSTTLPSAATRSCAKFAATYKGKTLP